VVFVDGVPQGSPVGWTARPDLVALFPEAQYSGVGSALALFPFDSTKFSNGVHTIAWGVRDTLGNAAGVGSRFFLISNNLIAVQQEAMTRPHEIASGAFGSAPWYLAGRRGFDAREPFRLYQPDAQGVITVTAQELERLELRTSASSAYLNTPDGRRPLPAGAHLGGDGTLTWQPGPGFVGTYELAFTTPHGDRIVRIVLAPKRQRASGVRVVIDQPESYRVLEGAFDIEGWAADLDALAGSGIDTIHVWALPLDGRPPFFVDVAALGRTRNDVGAAVGEQFADSGFSLRVSRLPAGAYDLALFAWSHRLSGFLPARTVRVTVR
jgi:hypothetical protein